MSEIGVRALKQNASAVVADAAAGEVITVTVRGRPVARLTAITSARLEELVSSGRARLARRDIAELPPPSEGPSLSEQLEAARAAERY